jgi:GGDEF domain-containing protein
MNYHHSDLLIVEPRDAEGRYRQLLQQRGQLLRNLSRSRAPQQVSLDFDGPKGPLPHVQFAVIPLPIARPGWGALLVERDASVEYSEAELDLCAEFAALATTAGDDAAEAMEARRANEYDAQSGVYRREVIEKLLKQAHDAAISQRTTLAVLRVGLDGNPATIATLADVVRDEIHYGDSVGRLGESELLVLLPERTVVAAREIGERVLSSARKAGVTVGVGISATQAGERTGVDVLDRAAKALVKSRAAGGQVQVVLAP